MTRALVIQMLDCLVKLSEQSDCDIDPFTFGRYGGNSAIKAAKEHLETEPSGERATELTPIADIIADLRGLDLHVWAHAVVNRAIKMLEATETELPEATYKLTHDKAAAVAPKIHWLAINERTPINTRMNLIHKPSGVAITGTRTAADHWTHWYPLPTFTE